MPRSGAGVYILPAGQPAITNTTISSSAFNLLTNDLANALTTSVATDGQTAMAANLSMGNNKITNLAIATLPGDAARFDQINGPGTGLYINVKNYGAVGNGSVDDTFAINQANSAATALGRTLFFPYGTYIATQLIVLAYQNWVGENVETTIKLKNGTNPVEGTSALIWCPDLNRDEASFTNFTFDGNSTNNTSGDLMTLYGCRTRIKNCKFMNAASNAIITNFNTASAERVSGIEGSYMDITIDSPQKSGWIHYGPNDSNFDGLIIIDAGLKTNSTYFGLQLVSPTGGGRFNNVHPWNRSTTTNVPSASINVSSAGSTFTNCHIEGGIVPLYLNSSGTTFTSCSYYGSRGPSAIQVTAVATSNIIKGTAGLVQAVPYRPTYNIITLQGGYNIVELTVVGPNSGVAFDDASTGGNIVTMTGYFATYAGQYIYSGTPSTTDQVNIKIGGTNGGTFVYPVIAPPAAATPFTSAITASSGSFTATIAAAYYYKIGKLVHYDVYYNISNIGTAGGLLQITLPSFCTANALGASVGGNPTASMIGNFTAGSLNYQSFANYNGSSPCTVLNNGHVGGWYVEV